MSRDKQIDAIYEDVVEIFDEEYGKRNLITPQYTAEKLTDKGYRKTSDVAEEIFKEIEDFQHTLRHIFLEMCEGNDYNTLNLLQIDNAIEALFDSHIAELKKKYTQEK